MLNSSADLLIVVADAGREVQAGLRIRCYSVEWLLGRPAAEGMISEKKPSAEA